MRLLFLLLSGFPVARAQFDDGYLGNRWGTPLTLMEQKFELKLSLQRGRAQQYRSNVETIGGVQLSSCDFEFTSGKFTGVILLTRDRANSHRLLALLRKTYGEGREDDTLGYQWFNKRTHVSYDEGRDGDAYVYLYCLTLAGM